MKEIFVDFSVLELSQFMADPKWKHKHNPINPVDRNKAQVWEVP